MNRIITGSFTRPADTNVYASGDVMNGSTTAGAVLTFARALAIRGNNALLVSALLIDGANQSLKLSSELWLFTVAPAADNDNAPFTPTDADLESLVGIIAFPTAFIGDGTVGATGNVVYPAVDMAKVFRSSSSSQDLSGVLVARNSYVPVSGGTFTVRLGIQE